jgi:23S rRNA (guanosine2251-2'-O)-methyltransferase
MNKVFGRKPVLEGLLSGSEFETIYIAYGQHGGIINNIISEAKKRGIKVSQISTHRFKDLSRNENTQGVIALKSEIKYFSLNEVITKSKKSKYPLLLILESIQDPHNVGAILRSAECAGVDGVLITQRESASMTEVVEKASAGAISHLKICKINNVSQTITELKEQGFWIVGSALNEKSKDYSSIDYKSPIALIMGNEEKGIKPLTAKNCDHLVAIPMKGKIHSLNVSVASGVLLFEILRSRNSD